MVAPTDTSAARSARLRPCAAVVRAAVALADAAWRVVRAAVVRRRRAVVELGAFAVAPRVLELREPVLRDVERERVLEVDRRAAGLRAAGLRAAGLRAAGLRV